MRRRIKARMERKLECVECTANFTHVDVHGDIAPTSNIIDTCGHNAHIDKNKPFFHERWANQSTTLRRVVAVLDLCWSVMKMTRSRWVSHDSHQPRAQVVLPMTRTHKKALNGAPQRSNQLAFLSSDQIGSWK